MNKKNPGYFSSFVGQSIRGHKVSRLLQDRYDLLLLYIAKLVIVYFWIAKDTILTGNSSRDGLIKE